MKRVVLFALSLLSVIAAPALVPRTAAASGPTPPFKQCPAVGLDTSCAVLLVVNPNGSLTVLTDPSQGPFDGIEDTLVGVQNNSPSPLSSLTLTGAQTNCSFGFCFTIPIFDLDGDGLCAVFPRPSGCPFGPTSYEGPGTSFSNISSDRTTGTVNLGVNPGSKACSGLAPGGSAYFSLEGQVTSGGISAAKPPIESGQASILKASGPGAVGTHTVVSTGPVSSTTPTTKDVSVATLPHDALASGSVADAKVTLGLGSSRSVATVAQLAVTPPLSAARIATRDVQAVSQTGCSASTGSTTIGYLQVGTRVIANDHPAPNTVYTLPDGVKVTLNEQTPIPNGLHVNAIHVALPKGVNVIIGSVDSAVTPG